MNKEFLNLIMESYRTGKILPLSTNRKINEKMLKDIHDLYVGGYLHLPKYCQAFGYSTHYSIWQQFKKRGWKTLNQKQINEIYRDEIQTKTIETNTQRFGCPYSMQSPEVQGKSRSTNLERYGYENPSQSPAVREKVKKTNLERYGVENVSQNIEVQEKRRQTNLERFGYECFLQSPEIRERIKSTNLKKYGSDNPFGSPEIRERIKSTNLKKYGFEYVSQYPEFKEKVKRTNLENLGCEYPTQSPEVMDKIRKTNLENLGCEYPGQSPKIKEKIKATKKSNDRRYAKLLDFVDNDTRKAHGFVVSNYSSSNHSTILRRYGLYQENLSTPEAAIREILEKHKIEYLFRYRPKFMGGKELDFFIPSPNNPVSSKLGNPIAIEVNGLYWHSYPKKDKYYHQDKHLRCRSEGIQLLSFTEDQILDRLEIIESMILHKLGLTPYRVYAKNCTIRELRTQEARDFLENNHLHGFSNASTYLGLEYNGKLVHVMSFGNNRFKKSDHPELIRSASLRFHSVAGGFQRLLKYYKKTYKVDLVESYVDFNISNGQSYELASKDLGDLGDSSVRETVRETERDNLTEPDLWFVYRNKRYRRQMFMKHNLHKIFEDFPVREDEGYKDINSSEYLKDRGVLEYYGAGNLKYLI